LGKQTVALADFDGDGDLDFIQRNPLDRLPKEIAFKREGDCKRI